MPPNVPYIGTSIKCYVASPKSPLHPNRKHVEPVCFIATNASIPLFRAFWIRLGEKTQPLRLKLYGALSGLVVAAVMGLESVMHALNIPHVEGWWAPLLGGGICLGTGAAWQKWRKKRK